VFVPNYIPEPIQVPGNVADAPHAVRVRFIRQVSLGAALAWTGLAALSRLAWPEASAVVLGVILLALLGVLSLFRTAYRGRRLESKVSAPFILPIVALAAWCLAATEWPFSVVVAPAFGLWSLAGYAQLAGRDFSFVGGFGAAAITGTLALAAADATLGTTGRAAPAMAVNLLVLLFMVYDLSCLLGRRRAEEAGAALVDLFRDPLNAIGYLPRVAMHWRKHRLWTAASTTFTRTVSRIERHEAGPGEHL
jgi:hypothetical protein